MVSVEVCGHVYFGIPTWLLLEGGDKYLKMNYKHSKAENNTKTFNSKITRFTKLYCFTKLTQPMKLIQLI